MAAFGTVLAFWPCVAYRPNCHAVFFNLAAKMAGAIYADYQSGNEFAAASPDILAGFRVQNRISTPNARA
jgi:hypothetical protein